MDTEEGLRERKRRETPALIAGTAMRLLMRRGEWAEETGARPGAAEPFVVAVALVGVIRAAFEAGPAGPGPDRDMATAALRLLAGGLSGYAVRPGPTEGLPA